MHQQVPTDVHGQEMGEPATPTHTCARETCDATADVRVVYETDDAAPKYWYCEPCLRWMDATYGVDRILQGHEDIEYGLSG